MHAAIVVVSYGSARLLKENLAVTAEQVPDAPVIVVDNFSTHAERTRVADLCRQQGWQLCASDENLGFGGGANLGIEAAFASGARDVLLLNPDARIDALAMHALAGVVDDDRMVLASPRVERPDGSIWFAGVDLQLDDGTMVSRHKRSATSGARRAEWLSGACLWITDDVWRATGPFDDDYFLYWEDVDYSWRAARAGVRLAVVDEAVVVHDEGGTHRDAGQRSEAKSETYYFYNVRNRLIFAAKNLGPDAVDAWSRSAIRTAWEIVLRGGRRQLLGNPAPLRAAWRGVREGRRAAKTILQHSSER